MTRTQTAQHKKAFLDAYRKEGTILQAAKKARIRRRLHYEWLDNDEKYAADFAEAEQDAIEALETEARRRSKHSDTLLIFLLKGARPEKYRDKIEHTGRNGGPIETHGKIEIEFVTPSPDPASV